MKKICLCLLVIPWIAGCGGGEDEAGGLTADERQRLENIADRLDEESAEVRELLEANAVDDAQVEPAENELP